MRRFLLSIVACSIMGGGSPSFAKSDDTTGICFRRITALNKKGTVVNRFESVIVRQSSSVVNDMARVERVSSRGGPLMSPDLLANTWIGASISDTMFDGTAREDCSKLPILRERRR